MARLRRILTEIAKRPLEAVIEQGNEVLPENSYFTDDATNNAYYTDDAKQNKYITTDV